MEAITPTETLSSPVPDALLPHNIPYECGDFCSGLWFSQGAVGNDNIEVRLKILGANMSPDIDAFRSANTLYSHNHTVMSTWMRTSMVTPVAAEFTTDPKVLV